jgi:hypothetical protein
MDDEYCPRPRRNNRYFRGPTVRHLTSPYLSSPFSDTLPEKADRAKSRRGVHPVAVSCAPYTAGLFVASLAMHMTISHKISSRRTNKQCVAVIDGTKDKTLLVVPWTTPSCHYVPVAALQVDERSVVVCTSRVELWDIAAGAVLASTPYFMPITRYPGLVSFSSVAVDPSGGTVAAVYDDHLHLLDGRTLQLRRAPITLPSHVEGSSRIAFSPNGKLFAYSTASSVMMFETADWQCCAAVPVQLQHFSPTPFASFCFSPCSTFIVVAERGNPNTILRLVSIHLGITIATAPLEGWDAAEAMTFVRTSALGHNAGSSADPNGYHLLVTQSQVTWVIQYMIDFGPWHSRQRIYTSRPDQLSLSRRLHRSVNGNPIFSAASRVDGSQIVVRQKRFNLVERP